MNKYQDAFDRLDRDTNFSNYGNEKDIEIIREAISLQRPRKPITKYSMINPNWTANGCPKCKKTISNDNYCYECGTKLDWSEE